MPEPEHDHDPNAVKMTVGAHLEASPDQLRVVRDVARNAQLVFEPVADGGCNVVQDEAFGIALDPTARPIACRWQLVGVDAERCQRPTEIRSLHLDLQ